MYIDIVSLIDTFKFGYDGNINNLIYLFLIFRFAVFPLIKFAVNKIGGVFNG